VPILRRLRLTYPKEKRGEGEGERGLERSFFLKKEGGITASAAQEGGKKGRWGALDIKGQGNLY